jgi:hypothetical protein
LALAVELLAGNQFPSDGVDVEFIVSDGVDLGLFIRNRAVGQIVFTDLGAQWNIRCRKVSR